MIISNPQPSRADAVKNRALLLETARRLFNEQGVEAVSMTAIADAAGVGKGTLYRHFVNKTELCHALLDHIDRNMQNRVLHRLRQMGDPLEDLRWFVTEIAHYVEENDELLCAADTAVLPTLEHPAHLWSRQTIRGLLDKIAITGDIDYTADVLYVLLDARTLRFQRRAMGYDTARILSGLHTTLDLLTR